MDRQGELTAQRVHQAILGNELYLEYMPTIALQDGERCVGCEALVRWRRGQEIVRPDLFVPVVENTPVSGLLTYWVIHKVAEELGDWLRKHRSAHVGINVPPEVLGRGGLEYASRKASLFDIRRQIILEITERGVPDRLGLNELVDLADEEILVAVDDMNTEESNFILLSRLPLPIIKLDKRFVDRLDVEPVRRRLEEISAFIRIGEHYVIAEGVETATQADLLRHAGVQYAQGWLFSKSIRVDEFIAFHAARQ